MSKQELQDQIDALNERVSLLAQKLSALEIAVTLTIVDQKNEVEVEGATKPKKSKKAGEANA